MHRADVVCCNVLNFAFLSCTQHGWMDGLDENCCYNFSVISPNSMFFLTGKLGKIIHNA